MSKNENIQKGLLELKARRKTQQIKVYELKVNVHSISKEDFAKFNSMFVQAKWAANDCIASENIFTYKYQEHKKVISFDKDGNKVERIISLNSGIHQDIIRQIKQDVINLSRKKKKGGKVGRLKFKRQVNTINLRDLKVLNSKTVSIPGFRKLKVYGLEQFINIPNFEIASPKLVRKASGIYLKVPVCTKKTNSKRIPANKEVGLDFGIKDNITTSDGEKFNCSVQESEYLKFLQRKLHKKQKNSKRYYKCLNQLQKEYEHLTNKKNDDSNKLIAYLLKEYDVIYFQDEQISKWKKFNKGFARNIQHSYLGRVKAKLVELQKTGRSFEISKWSPSTKFCPQCGSLNDGITLSDRIFKCSCGYQFDRDVHAAKNVKLFGSTKRAEWLEQPSVDSLVSTALEFSGTANQEVEAKNEAVVSSDTQ